MGCSVGARVVLGLLVVLAACDPPGDSGSLGTFDVTATLTSNTCGPQADGFQSAVSFPAEIRVRQGLVHWIPQNSNDTVGTYDLGTGAFRLELDESIQRLAPDRAHQFPGCVIDRADVIQGILGLQGPDGGTIPGLDAGTSVNISDGGQSADATATTPRIQFTGTQTIVFASDPSGDCSALIGGASGTYTTLPCTVTYAIQGVGR